MVHALSYEEPSLVHLLVLASFIYLLNVSRVLADFALYAGVVAEIALGIVYGAPLTALLPFDWQSSFTALGYLGLILVVFEGGLSTNLPLLLSNLPFSIVCALTGIALPIAFSFALLKGAFGYHPLEAFAAGAALSSTSLGTTLAALNSVTRSQDSQKNLPASSSGSRGSISDGLNPGSATPSVAQSTSSTLESSLQQSRIGTVLISAAIIDDVIGLVIASLIPALASIDSDSDSSLHIGKKNLAWTILRPLLASFLIAVVTSVVARYILRPMFWYHNFGERWCAPARDSRPWGTTSLTCKGWGTVAHADAAKLMLMVLIVSAMAAITNYTGTSVLYGAYISGLVLTYISRPPDTSSGEVDGRAQDLSFEISFERTIGPLQSHLLLPLFFASIGFAIPFLDLWHPIVIWRGIVYSVLMCIAKLAVGIPVLAYPATVSFASSVRRKTRSLASYTFRRSRKLFANVRRKVRNVGHPEREEGGLPRPSSPPAPPRDLGEENKEGFDDTRDSEHSLLRQTVKSIPPSMFMGVAMVSRGEIGLLIAQLARTGSQGDSSDTDGAEGLLGDEAFLVCIWAILLCTLVGPISVGFVVRRWGSRVTAGMWA